jgi:hypothetical protein
MKKKEIYILVAIAVLSVAALLVLKNPFWKQEEEPKTMVGIYHRDKLIHAFDPEEDAVYHVQGSYGTLDVEVKDSQWHVTNEECPNHICAGMGWVTVDDLLPITCMPNEVYIMVLETAE